MRIIQLVLNIVFFFYSAILNNEGYMILFCSVYVSALLLPLFYSIFRVFSFVIKIISINISHLYSYREPSWLSQSPDLREFHNIDNTWVVVRWSSVAVSLGQSTRVP